MTGRKNSGISPVVATVILVAVAIVIAIAVAFWASGLVGVFTRFEKIEIVAAYPVDTDDDGALDAVRVTARNTGSTDAAVDMIFVNGRPCNAAVGGSPTTIPTTIPIGGSQDFDVPFDDPQGTNPGCVIPGGVTNEIALHTTSGKTYPVAVLVP